MLDNTPRNMEDFKKCKCKTLAAGGSPSGLKKFVNYLHITLNLKILSYKPDSKPNNTPQ